jgi:TRAP-type C4-dicarboxylate transport system substrate-binding protein
MLDAMGANATPIPFGEVFTGLQTHLIDAAENNWATFQSTRQYEVAPYFSQTDHCAAPEALLMSKARFDSMSSSDQELILAKARESIPIMRGLWDTKQATARQTVLDAGVHFNQADTEAFRRAVEPMKRRWMQDENIAATVRRIDAHE